MAFSIKHATDALQDDVAWQRTPQPITVSQYAGMIMNGIKRLYIDTGRALLYNPDNYYEGDDGLMFDADLNIDEEAYIMICAKIGFFKRVQNDVNNAFSYSTNAITVTGADRPYANLRDTLSELEKDRRELFYRMPRFTLDYEIAD